MQFDTNDQHYIKGFEDGCDYIVREIERWGKEHNLYVLDVLHHLRSGDDRKKSSISDEVRRTNWDLL
jgi:hypothetical protein